MKLSPLLLLLPGCSLLFEPVPASVGPDAGSSAPDADPSAPDAAPLPLASNALGTYSITFEVTSGCSVSVYVADRLDVSPEGLVFRSDACAEHGDVSASYTEIDEGSIMVDALELELWNCERTVRYDVSPFVMAFADGQGLAEVRANQVLPPSMNVSCVGEYSLSAEK